MSEREPGAVEAADVALGKSAAKHRANPAVRAVGLLSEIADQAPLYGLSGAVLAVGLVTGRRALARTGAKMLAAHSIAALAKIAVKKTVSRTRPALLLDADHYEARTGGPDEHDFNSFPSGHTAGAVAVARAASRGRPAIAVPAALAATAVSAVQVPRAKHYPIDVAAGAVIGLLADVLGSLLVDRFWPKRAAPRRAEERETD